MKRVVWVAVTILIMIGILGYGLHTLNRIEEVNQQRREKDAGEDFVAKITMTTASTSIWDRLRETETAAAIEGGVPAEGPVGETVSPMPVEPGVMPTEAPEEQAPAVPGVVETAPEQTVTTPIVIQIQ